MNDILEILYQGKTLNQMQCEKLFYNIINNQLSPIQIGSALISMKIRGETYEEIIGASHMLLSHAKPFIKPNILFADITGTGGDNKNTINISTISAIVASVCGAKIIKHGNYSTSSLSGSMDFLKQNYKHIEINKDQSLKLFNKLGICFLCASQYYTVFKDVMFIRKQLKTPTLFNIVGPLINPSKPPLALIGVYKKELLLPVAQALKFMQRYHALIVHCNGIDEVGLHAPTHVLELYNNVINDYILTPSDFGLNKYPIKELCYNSKESAQIHMINLLKGQGKKSHISVIAANVALLLKLFGYNDLRSNVLLVLDKIQKGDPYKQFLSLSNVPIRQ